MVLCWNSLRKRTRRENKEFHLQNSFHWSMELVFWNCVRLSFICTTGNQHCLWFLELSVICWKNYKIKWEDDSICSFFSCFSHEKTKRLQNERANIVFINNRNDRNKTWKMVLIPVICFDRFVVYQWNCCLEIQSLIDPFLIK